MVLTGASLAALLLACSETKSGPTTKAVDVPAAQPPNEVTGTTADALQISTSAYYYLAVNQSHLCLDDQNGSTTSGTAVNQATCAANTNTQWQFSQISSGVYNLINKKSGMCLYNGGSTGTGALLTQATCGSATSYQWTVTDLGNGFINIKNKNSGFCVDDAGGSTSAGHQMDQTTCSSTSANMSWQLIQTSPNGTTASTCGTAGNPTPWPEANAILCAVQPPTFPSKNCLITSYGASTGSSDNTSAIASAISDCHNAGGGTVEVPSGTFKTGAIYLKSNINLKLDSGSTLSFVSGASYPTVVTRYQGMELNNHSPAIYAYGETNIAVTGSGTIDVNGLPHSTAGSAVSQLQTWSNNNTPLSQRNLPSGEALPTAAIEPYNSTNVYLQGFTLKNAHFWQVHPTLSTNVIVNGIHNIGTSSHTDGVDPEASQNVIVENSTLQTGDDCSALKSGSDNDGRVAPSRGYGVSTQNVVFYNNTCYLTPKMNGGMVTIGSEESGGVQHVYAYNVHAQGTNEHVLYMKSNTQRGGVINDVHVDTVGPLALSQNIVYATFHYSGSGNGGPCCFNPSMSNIFVSNVTVTSTPQLLNVNGLSNDSIGPMTFTNNTWTNSTNVGSTITYANITYSNTTFNGKEL
jgi:hypothetical protein